jgi:hypothetical protein
MLLQATIGIPNKVLMLSATIVDKPDNFAVFGYILGLSSSLSNMRRFIASYTSEASLSAKLHDLVFPIHGGRLKISSLGANFPKNIIITDTLFVDKDIAKEIDNNYKEIKKCLEELKNKEIKDKGNILSKMLRSRQKIEMLKLPMLISLINDNLENLIILPITSGDLKELDKRSAKLKNHIKQFDVEYLMEVDLENILKFVRIIGYNILIVGSESEYQKIKNTPHTTVKKVFEDLLKDPKVVEEFNEQIEQEYISGADMIKNKSEEHLKINSQVYKMALSLVGFDINNYKIFKTENEKLEAVEEEVTMVISLIKNNYSFKFYTDIYTEENDH